MNDFSIHYFVISNPIVGYKLQVALDVLEHLSQRTHISPICKEMFHLLQRPHVQVRFRLDGFMEKLIF